jgi:hypothetical protein
MTPHQKRIPRCPNFAPSFVETLNAAYQVNFVRFCRDECRVNTQLYEVMSKYLSVEEEQVFWTELFAVTFRYEQRRVCRDERPSRGTPTKSVTGEDARPRLWCGHSRPGSGQSGFETPG